MRMWGGHVNNVDIWISDELGVRTIRGSRVWSLDFRYEVAGARSRGGRCDGNNLVGNIINVANCWVSEKVFCKC